MSEVLQAAVAAKLAPLQATTIRLDIGSGPSPKEGFVGIDSIAFGKNIVTNIGDRSWVLDKHIDGVTEMRDGCIIFQNDSVSEANCSHVLEHLTNFNDKWERIFFWNELWRIMAKDAKLSLVLPHWNSNRFYGDPTHKEPWSEMSFYYLDKTWRMANAPHTDIKNNPNGYSCDWEFTFGYSMHGDIIMKNAEMQRFALTFYKEAAQDIISTLTPRKE